MDRPVDEWGSPAEPEIPTGPDSFPAAGANSLARYGTRGWARTIDTLLTGIPVLLGTAVVATLLNASDDDFALWVGAAWFVVAFAYETTAVAWKGQTLGKFLLGIRVARLDNGRTPLWWQAGTRIALPAVIAVIPGGLPKVISACVYFSSAWDPMVRGMHDKAAGTVVVRTR